MVKEDEAKQCGDIKKPRKEWKAEQDKELGRVLLFG